MKLTDKIYEKYKDKSLERVFDTLKNADEDDLRAFAAIMVLEAREGAAEAKTLCEGLGITLDELSTALKFWKGAGLVSTKKASKKADSESEAKADKPDKVDSCHRDGKLEGDGSLPSYSTEELTSLMKRRNITSDFIGEAARAYGKVFNQHEVEIVVRMIDYIGFDEESVLMLLSFYSKHGRKTLRYIEKVALEFYDEGISDWQSLQKKLMTIESAQEIEGQIRTMFGMSGRSLTTKEKKYISSWTEKMGFGIEMIRLAYDITVDNTHEAAPAYANGILESWYAKGIDTPEKVEEDKEKRSSSKSTGVSKSFNNDEFFEAALKRAYEDKN